MAEGESEKTDESRKQEAGEITFRCQSCDKYTLLEEMRVVTRFFPLIVVCRECEKQMR